VQPSPIRIWQRALVSFLLIVSVPSAVYPLSNSAPLAAASAFLSLAGQPPAAPANPRPANGAVNVIRLPLYLGWDWYDPDSPTNEFDVYFGTSSPPPMAATVQYNQYTAEGPFPLGALEPSRLYYWKIVARDPDGNVTEGPIWSFTTSAPNPPPPTPCNPLSPVDHATNVPLSLGLKWDDCGGTVPPWYLYDVYFGTSPNPPKVATNVTIDSHYSGYFVGGLLQTTDYYWKIVSRDIDGYESTGPTWTFQTKVNPNNNITLGLYGDAQATSCNLSDAGGPGVRTAYVVLNGPTALTSCRFAAPIPSCFDAAWLGDNSAYATIGTSPQDISVGFGGCLVPPIQVMSIYYLSNGNTRGCCSFPMAANSWPGLLVTDCNYVQLDVRNFPVLGISTNGSCPSCGPVATKPTTWGALKALYR
jgi:hypothetical protein